MSMPRDTDLTSIKDDGKLPAKFQRQVNAFDSLLSRVDKVLESTKKAPFDRTRKSLFYERLGQSQRV